MNQDLSVAFNSLVKLIVRPRCFVKGHVVGDYEGWFGLPCNDEVSKVSIVCLNIALSSTQLETLTAC
jgi:hypothetical protein